ALEVDLDLARLASILPLQRAEHLGGEIAFRFRVLQMNEDLVQLGLVETLDADVSHLEVLERAAHPAEIRLRLELEGELRAAREVHPKVEALGEDERDRQHVQRRRD